MVRPTQEPNLMHSQLVLVVPLSERRWVIMVDTGAVSDGSPWSSGLSASTHLQAVLERNDAISLAETC